MSNRILLIVANPSLSTTLGWSVGFWASELIHPYDAFTKAGCQVTIASPHGGKVEFDSLSDPRDASGYSKDDTLSAEYIDRPEFMALLANTVAIADRVVGQKVMPFRIEDEARQLGANFVTKAAFAPHAVRDGNLITGQQQNSGAETAKLVLTALGV